MNIQSLRYVPLATPILVASFIDAESQDGRKSFPLRDDKQSEYQTICGTDDLQDVERYTGYLSKAYIAQHSAPTVLLRWKHDGEIATEMPGYSLGNIGGYRWCTGSRISSDLILTASHCVDPLDGSEDSGGWITPYTEAYGKTVYAEPKQLAKLLRVYFNYQRYPKDSGRDPDDVRTPDIFSITELVEWVEDTKDDPYKRIDYAILRIGVGSNGNLPDAIKYPPARVQLQEPKVGDKLVIFQHPDGKPMKVAHGTLKAVKGAAFLYSDIDTLDASSGAPIRNEGGIIVGVHTRGGCKKKGGLNRGVKNSAIAPISNNISTLAK